MSRILRRPMFRGGRVDSRGTGITTGLMDGGRVGYRNGNFVSGQQIMDANRNNTFFNNNSLNKYSSYGIGNANPELNNLIKATMFDTEQYPRQGKLALASDDISATEFYETSENDDTEGLLVSTDTSMVPSLKNSGEASEGEIFNKPKPTVEEEPSTVGSATIPTPKVNEPDTEVTMTDLERALGLDDARKEYVGDALAAASKGFFEGKGFGAISDAAAVKSKAPDIKRLAGLEEFKADRAQKLYETKLKNQQYAPSNTEKLINTMKKIKEGSQSQKIALLNLKLEPSIEGQIKAMTNKDKFASPPSAGEVISIMSIYYPQSFKGTISSDTQPTVDGTYILEDASAILFVEDGKTSIKKLK